VAEERERMPLHPIEPTKTGLVLFDMLNDFVRPADPSRARHTAESGAIERSVEMVGAARTAGIAVFYANSTHRPDASDYGPTIVDANINLEPWPDGPKLMGNPPATEGTQGAQVIAELTPGPNDYIVLKHRWSAFAGTSLDMLLRWLGIDTILLAGGSTDLGVLATAYAARDLGYHLVVLRDACHTHRPNAQEFCMDQLFPRMARVMSVMEVVSLIPDSRASSTPAS
jgi:nicotinamidase-related amidase